MYVHVCTLYTNVQCRCTYLYHLNLYLCVYECRYMYMYQCTLCTYRYICVEHCDFKQNSIF